MSAETPIAVVQAFVAAINAGELPALRALMTDDHTFTDALGHSVSGADKMILGWQHFLRSFPAYQIVAEQSFAEGSRVALFGMATGGWRVDGEVLPDRWSVRGAWLARVADGRIARWSVFCDTGWANAPSATQGR